jgi:hypothetical protein
MAGASRTTLSRRDNIVAMGDEIKLAPWTIGRAEEGLIEEDRIDAGQTIVLY